MSFRLGFAPKSKTNTEIRPESKRAASASKRVSDEPTLIVANDDPVADDLTAATQPTALVSSPPSESSVPLPPKSTEGDQTIQPSKTWAETLWYTSKPIASSATADSPSIEAGSPKLQKPSSWLPSTYFGDSKPAAKNNGNGSTTAVSEPDNVQIANVPKSQTYWQAAWSTLSRSEAVDAVVKNDNSQDANDHVQDTDLLIATSTVLKRPKYTIYSAKAAAVPTPTPDNHVLPPLDICCPLPATNESKTWRIIRQLLSFSPSNPLSIQRQAPPPAAQQRRAVAIGIHGFFPHKSIQRVIGEPTGTSVKFASMASEAIHRYYEATYGKNHDFEVVQIALQGEGKVAHRIELFWRILREGGAEGRKWLDYITDSDLIIVACHSQGAPVGAGVVAKLIEEGFIAKSTKIGLLFAAGICLGPGMEVGQKMVIKAYNSFDSEAAGELYEFQRSSSLVSRRFIDALRIVISQDARIILIGSLDDHLVPMYSSTFSTIDHPSLYRSLFVDGTLHQTDFLVSLVAFTLRLRNASWSDNNLLEELSPSLMGSFYTGSGHSSIYKEPSIYEYIR